MSVIRTNAAAAMLGVSTNTLRSWERRFGFPEPRRTAGGHRQYEVGEIEALRSAFAETRNVASAVSLARARGEGPASASRLRGALLRFDEAEADHVLEESLAVRSVERTVDELLLAVVDGLAGEGGGAGEALPAELGFAWRWATGWLAAQTRAAPPATRPDGIVVFEATAPCDVDALHAQALELGLRRRGVRALTLTVTLEPERLVRALHAVAPRAVVLTGRRASIDALGRLVFAAHRVGAGTVRVFDFRGALPETGASTVERLGVRALPARDRLVRHLDGRDDERAAAGRRAPLRAVRVHG
jgi:MerR family transcriptional regulator, light-induced transcriptional regulator